MVVDGKVVEENLVGSVKWFNNQKGYGFIVGEGSEEDIFVHYSSIVEEGYKTLKENQKVAYTLMQTERGLQASEVRKA